MTFHPAPGPAHVFAYDAARDTLIRLPDPPVTSGEPVSAVWTGHSLMLLGRDERGVITGHEYTPAG